MLQTIHQIIGSIPGLINIGSAISAWTIFNAKAETQATTTGTFSIASTTWLRLGVFWTAAVLIDSFIGREESFASMSRIVVNSANFVIAIVLAISVAMFQGTQKKQAEMEERILKAIEKRKP